MKVCKELLGILWQAVAAVAEAGVVVMGSNARIKTNALNDFARIEALAFGIGVELVEV